MAMLLCIPIVVLAIVPVLLLFVIHALVRELFKWLFIFAWSVRWLPQGVDALLVYNNSPYWQTYFEQEFLPLFKERCFVLNWSERRRWKTPSWRVIAWHLFARQSHHCPSVIWFRRFRLPLRFHFYQPIKDLKHGKEAPVRNLERDLSIAFDAAVPPLSIDHGLLHGPGPP
ncbi:MAG: hypothetical protein AAF266_08790 [Planctomycetota bacterium]